MWNAVSQGLLSFNETDTGVDLYVLISDFACAVAHTRLIQGILILDFELYTWNMHVFKLAFLLWLVIHIIRAKSLIYTPNLPPGGKLVIVDHHKSGVKFRYPCYHNIRLMSRHMSRLLLRIEDSLNLIYPRLTGIKKLLKQN